MSITWRKSRRRTNTEKSFQPGKGRGRSTFSRNAAVPKAERHRLKEFSVEEAYADWKLRLVQEKLEPEELEYGRLEEEYQGLLDEWKMSEAYWMTEPAARMTEKTEAESSGEKDRRRDSRNTG